MFQAENFLLTGTGISGNLKKIGNEFCRWHSKSEFDSVEHVADWVIGRTAMRDLELTPTQVMNFSIAGHGKNGSLKLIHANATGYNKSNSQKSNWGDRKWTDSGLVLSDGSGAKYRNDARIGAWKSGKSFKIETSLETALALAKESADMALKDDGVNGKLQIGFVLNYGNNSRASTLYHPDVKLSDPEAQEKYCYNMTGLKHELALSLLRTVYHAFIHDLTEYSKVRANGADERLKATAKINVLFGVKALMEKGDKTLKVYLEDFYKRNTSGPANLP